LIPKNKYITKKFKCVDVANNDDLGASIGLENDDDLFLWNVTFEGPESSLYEVSEQISTGRNFGQGNGLAHLVV